MNNFETNTKSKYQPVLDWKDKIINEKDKEIARLKALLNMDGTNAGIPASQTPIHKKKIIPNNRIKSEKNKGGQIEHKKHQLEKFNDILLEDIEKNKVKPQTHYDKTEKSLLNRILEYKSNYFLWMYDFSLSSDDNLNERALREGKSKMKIAGQF